MKKIILLCLLLIIFSVEDSTYSSTGWVLESSDSYLGIRFNVDNQLFLTSISINATGNGEFFTGIVKLNTPTGMPNVVPGFKTNTLVGGVSSDTATDANILLDSGSYAVIFGGVGSAFGLVPWASDLTKSNIPLTDYLEYRSSGGGWVEFDYSGIRVALEGNVSPVPLPPSIVFMLTGLCSLFGFYRRRSV